MRYIFLVMSVFFLAGCLTQNRYQPSNKEQLANEIILKVASELRKKTNLHPCGSGGQMMNEIKMLALAFDCYAPLDISEGRKLLIVAVNEFVDAVNADEQIRPYLFNYPFEAKNIEIRIFIQNPDGSQFGQDRLCVISAIDGMLKYKMNDPEGPLFKIVYEETYEEAVQKIK
jgi:hypothetical protein